MASLMTEIFVFGSNLAGRHGKGAALDAARYHGAKRGVGQGRTGNAYAIPTKDAQLRVLPLKAIEAHVHSFLAYARRESGLQFKVTAIGTGLAGYSHEQIAPMFKDAPANCVLPDEWRVFKPGIGYMMPGVCTPSYCSRGHGAKCFNARRCIAEREARKAKRRSPG